MKLNKLKKRISGLMFVILILSLPLVTTLAKSSSSALTAATVAYGDSTDQTVAVVFDTLVSVGIYTGFLCGIQGLVAIVAAG